MDSSIQLTKAQRKQLRELYRKHHDPYVRLRSHIIMLLAMGRPWMTITTMLFCSSKTISRRKWRFQHEEIEALTQKRRGRPPKAMDCALIHSAIRRCGNALQITVTMRFPMAKFCTMARMADRSGVKNPGGTVILVK